MTDIAAIGDRAALISAAISPTLETVIRFVELHYSEPIEEQDCTGSPSEITRGFQVLPGTDVRLTKWRKCQTGIYIVQGLNVKVRYQVPRQNGGVKRLANLVATDVPKIIPAFISTQSVSWGEQSIVRQIDLPALISPPVQINAAADLYLQTLQFRIQYAIP